MINKLQLGLTPRLTLILVLFAMALVVFVGMLAYNSGRNGLEDATISALSSTANEKEAALESWIKERQSDLGVIAASPRILEFWTVFINARPGSAEARTAHNHLIAELEPNTGQEFGLLAVSVMDPETGQIMAATNSGQEGTFKENRPYFINGKNGPYIQNPYYSLSRQRPTMILAMPLRAGDGRLLGVLAAEVNLNEMNDIIARRTGLRKTEDSFVVNAESLFVTQPPLVTDPVALQRGVHTEGVKRCLAGNSGVVLAEDYRDIPAIIVYRWLAERQLCLIVKMDQDEALAPIQAFRSALVAIGALALLVASALAVALSRTITHPILALQTGVMRFGQGESNFRLPVTTGDEIGSLGRAFNTMADTISENEGRLRDYTNRLETANTELEAFAYSVSHDLRAPLRAIDGFSRILIRDYEALLPPQGQHHIQRVRDNAQQMGRLIDDLLTFSRLSRQPLNKEPVSLANLVRHVISELTDDQQDRQVEIDIGELPVCQVDPALFKQVYVNLLSNALKFTRQRDAARIEVGCRQLNEEMVYFVKDNGTGFDMRYADKLFGVFQRLHRAEDYEGTGVGLAIVQRIIHRHGGRVWAEAEVDQGATFYFTLERDTPHD